MWGKTIIVLVAIAHAQAQAPTKEQLQDLQKATTIVDATDVCKSDEWSYLCNKGAWAGAADAVTGGQELQTAALRRALDHTIKHTSYAANDPACFRMKAIVDAQLLDIPKVIDSGCFGHVHTRRRGCSTLRPFDAVRERHALKSGFTATVLLLGSSP